MSSISAVTRGWTAIRKRLYDALYSRDSLRFFNLDIASASLTNKTLNLAIEELETRLKLINEPISSEINILVDLSRNRFSDVSALISLLQYIRELRIRYLNYNLYFSIPYDDYTAELIDQYGLELFTMLNDQCALIDDQTRQKVKALIDYYSFLYTWRFPEAVETIENTGFETLLTQESYAFAIRVLDKLHIDRNSYINFKLNLESFTSRTIRDLFTRGLFRIRVRDSSRSNLLEEYSFWANARLDRFLRVMVKNYIPMAISQRIVSEALSNILHHPQSRFFVSGSIFLTNEHKLLISYWDDGDSILDTLSDAILSGKAVRNNTNIPELEPEIIEQAKLVYVVHEKSDFGEKSTYVSSDDIQTSDLSNEAKLSLMALAPGYSRLASSPVKHPSEGNVIAGNGIGLHRSIVTTLGYNGTVSIRTKDVFISVKNHNTDERNDLTKPLVEDQSISKLMINVVIKKSCHTVPGNHVTYRIPIR